MSEKMRVHILAKTLNVPSKVILEKCRAEGLGSVVKNHMSTLSAGLDATIREWFSEGSHDTVLETTARIDLGKARRKRRPATTVEAPTPPGAVVTAESGGPVSKDLAAPVVAGVSAAEQSSPSAVDEKVEAVVVTVAEAPAVETAAPIADVMVDVDDTAPSSAGVSVPASDPGLSEVASGREDNGSAIIAADEASSAVAAIEPPADAGVVKDSGTDEAKEHPDRSGEPPGGAEAAEDSEKPDRIQAAGPQNVPAPAKLQGPRVVRYEPIDYSAQRAPRSLPPRTSASGTTPVKPPALRPAPGVGEGRKAGPRRGRISPRRAAGRTSEAGERLTEYRDRDLAERRQRLAGATGRRIHGRRSAHGGAAAAAEPKTDVTINEPIYMKDFCAATGLNFIQCLTALRDEQNLIANINMVLPSEAAQLLAMHFDITLHVVAAKTKLDEIKEQFAKRERAHPQSRPPVVTVLGHVDHGKTSLLDAFRKTKVVDTEDGGITQHIGATHIKTPHGTVTFLDTPGHAAFTAMRARGAQLTDVVVLIIAADDGVMPQTVEAINHAKAAKVPVVVALTKIDLGDQNKLKIYGQLAEHDLAPSEWGGTVDVIPTSVVTGEGIAELIEHLSALSDLLDLKADPTLPAEGTVVEAETKPGVGPVVTVLVQDGTLRVGNVVVCGNAFGKVRALVGDGGKRVKEASPAVPVEVWGLSDVPVAGDKLYCVETLQVASEIAGEIKRARIEQNRQQSRKMNTLEEMFLRRDSEEIPELNVIIKADVDGSVAVLRETLTKMSADEVTLAIRHAGVGPVNDSDVQLAATSNAIIVSFRVDISPGARRLADRLGVDVRAYRVIYNVTDDIKKALEGLLAPEEKIETRGSAEVREVFHISKLGVVAGCHVTSGTVDRGHLAKVIRDGVVVREGSKLSSLRRFKEDVKEVRSGLECGIRLEGFDDVHAGDVIEMYEIVKIPRKL